ncbi:MAG: response regulator [Lachnospiraceae bacterium]|nr:response regulator [Lachnospiraceae bacterium]
MIRIDHYNVLLADDEYMIRQSLSRRIRETDDSFRVVAECAEGRSAFETVEKGNIQVVFTDIRMPEVDGLKLAKLIHENHPDVLTVILTGYADFQYAQEAIRQEVFDYLLKPVSDDDLAAVLEKLSLKLQQKYILPDEEGIKGKSIEEIALQTENYLKEHFREEIDLGKLAEDFGISSAYLSKIFARSKQESPVRYLTALRMNEAKRLLTMTDEPIARVGELSGYPDQFYFSRIFRKETGENPTAFRKKNTKN